MLAFWARRSGDEQRSNRDTINAAFAVFWQSGPSRSAFAAATSGLVLTPEMLYEMVTHPLPAEVR